ncbi:hypothetical protein [Streptomyces pactum]|nr:hypothetical protein [Streptomyces pactum]
MPAGRGVRWVGRSVPGPAERLLVAVGRTPVTDGLDLTAAGLHQR